MKNLALILFTCLISIFAIAGGPEKPSAAQREITRFAMKREIQSHFHFPELENNDHEVIAFIELVADSNGVVTLLQIRTSSASVEDFVKDAVKKMKLSPVESMPGESFIFKMRFRLLD